MTAEKTTSPPPPPPGTTSHPKSPIITHTEKRKDLTPTGAADKKAPPPLNIFSNDGSFMERFRQLQSEQDEKRKQQEAIEKKKLWEQSFKTRGKRKKAPTDSESSDSPTKKLNTESEEPSKQEMDATASAYLREMRKMKEKLPGGETGSGVRPLVK